jgi:hypothetical protein
MSGTLNATVDHGITLVSPTYGNPLTVSGDVLASVGDGIFAATNWTIDNGGTISATSGEGIFLKGGGVIDNSGIVIGVNAYGITSTSAPLTLLNSGYIHGGKAGIAVNQGQLIVDNLMGATISGGLAALEGVKFSGDGPATSTLVNDGVMSSGNTSAGGGVGVWVALGSFTNTSTGVVSGGSIGINVGDYSNFSNFGVDTGQVGLVVGASQNDVTIIDGGTITGAGGEAVSFAKGVIADSLTLLPGAVLNGFANGGDSANLIFGGTSVGTMANLGHEVSLFPTISLSNGAAWEFAGTSAMAGQALFDNNGTLIERNGDSLSITSSMSGTGTIDLSGGTVALGNVVGAGQVVDFQGGQSALLLTDSHSFSGEIASFTSGDTIEIMGFGVNETVTSHQSGNLFTWTAGGLSSSTITFATDPGTLALVSMGPVSSVTAAYEIVAPPCFRAGTQILTPDGPRAVEDLRTGDTVVTHDGRARPLIWVGQRWVDCDRHPNPEMVLPIVIERSAFGPGVPSRDLYVSPDHAIYCAGLLIAAKHLINGISIRQIDVPEVIYHHIELMEHSVVWAETLPVETYLDCGNRHNFVGSKGLVSLHADFAAPHWDRERAFAPLVSEGADLTAVRLHLHERLCERGVHPVAGRFDVFADGRLLTAKGADNGQWIFRLPIETHRFAVNSTSSRPADLDPASLDCRRLGVAITDVTVDGRLVDAGDTRFMSGFHTPELRGRRWFRWTDGAAVFDASGAREIAFRVQAVSPVWQTPLTLPQPKGRLRALELHSQ